MFSIIKACGQGLEDYLAKNVDNGVNVFEFRDLFARYSTNIISSVAFGIENDCINEPDHIFRKMGAKIFKPNFKNGVRGMMQFLMPEMFYKIGLRFVDDDVEEFIFSIVNQTVKYREKNNITRNDLMQALIQLKNQGYVAVDKKDENIEADKKKLTMNEVAAQCLVFYLAGEFFTL
jgi:cytochrome P450 family 6